LFASTTTIAPDSSSLWNIDCGLHQVQFRLAVIDSPGRIRKTLIDIFGFEIWK